jgi:hypothetical protein
VTGERKKGPAIRKLVTDALLLKRREKLAQKFIDAEKVHGGVAVVPADDLLGRLPADLVGCAQRDDVLAPRAC